MNRYYLSVAKRANYKCEYCLAPERIFNFHFEVDHIIPVSETGSDKPENLALACRACNSYKAFFTKGLIPDSNISVRLFHPRRDIWAEHFSINLETLEVESKSEIGSATVKRLKLNSLAQIKSRSLWNELNIFP